MNYILNENNILKKIGNHYYLDNKKISSNDIIIFQCLICKKEIKKIVKEFVEQKCGSCRRKQTNLKKYNIENPYSFGSEKYKEIIKKKYNVENISQLEIIKEKKRKTTFKNYNVLNPIQNNQIRNKAEQTKLKKYGTKNNYYLIQQTKLKKYGNKNYNNIKQIKQTNLKKYNVENLWKNNNIIINIRINKLTRSYNKFLELQNIKPLFTLKEYLQKQNKYDKFKWQCKTCNTEFIDYYANGIMPKCPTCYPKLNGYSLSEKEIVNYCKFLTFNVLENSRQIIPPYEVDIYLPDYKLAIEFNGLYYHSTKFKLDKYYHQNKVKLANEKGIRLLHIWEHEWLEEKDLVKETINYYINNLNEEIKPEEPKLYNIYDNLIWI